MAAKNKPQIRIVGLHIRGLKCIQKLDWPADGLNWGDRVPDTVVVGGANGSGKSTLLDLLYAGLRILDGDRQEVTALIGSVVSGFSSELAHANKESKNLSQFAQAMLSSMPDVWVDFDLTWGSFVDQHVRFLVGTPGFIAANRTDHCFGLGPDLIPFVEGPLSQQLLNIRISLQSGLLADIPAVIYLPSRRYLATRNTENKRAGKLAIPRQFVYRWERPTTWDDSIEALLYDARFADLNATANGRAEKATQFAAYALAFESFYEGTKKLEWTDEGDLVVAIRDSQARHGLAGLSDGEKQVIVLCAELLLRWRPGSLILIDEPELHLHPHFQARLLDMLEGMQKERGGQVILATQSTDIWNFAPKNSSVLLGQGRS